MSHDLRLQHSITNATYRHVDRVRRQIVTVEHVEGTVQYVLDRLVIVGSHVKLGMIVSAGEGELTYDIWISGHVHLDEPRRGWDSMFIGDGEGDEVLPDVVDKSLRWFDRDDCTSCSRASVSWGGRWPYQFRSRNSSCFPSSLSLTYAHSLRRPFIRWDERGCRYFDGIFVVFIDKSGNLSCQCGNVHVHEANSGHLSMWHVGGSDKYGCDGCWYQDRIGGFMSVAVLHGTITSITVSSIWLIV